ncbi:CDP-glycerol glycerophosphotransferase family protein [Terrisporobacter sp.]
MYNLQVKIVSLLVKFLDNFLFMLKVNPKKITYISYRHDKLPYSMREISKSLKEIGVDYEEVYLPMKFKNTILNKIRYFFEIIKQVIHVKTSKIVIIDGNNIVISNLKKSNTKIIQIWHASNAIKKFGQDYKRKFPITKCDYMIAASSKTVRTMASAFDIDEDKVIPLGYTESDILFNKKKVKSYKDKMYKKYPLLKNKKVILYAPTFRGDAIYEKKTLDINLKKIASSLGDDYVIMYKMHPIISKDNIEKCDNLINMSHVDIYKLFSVTDVLISDFSSIIVDFTILEKPILLYTPDLDVYEKERGLYVDYKEFAPGPILYNEDELIDAIKKEKFDINKVKKTKEEFYDYKDDKSSYRIAEFIYNMM